MGDSPNLNERKHRWSDTTGWMRAWVVRGRAFPGRAAVEGLSGGDQRPGLIEIVQMIPGEKRLVFEEGQQSAWLCEAVRPNLTEFLATGISESRAKRAASGMLMGWPRSCGPKP
jgi:hypothetical protein